MTVPFDTESVGAPGSPNVPTTDAAVPDPAVLQKPHATAASAPAARVASAKAPTRRVTIGMIRSAHNSRTVAGARPRAAVGAARRARAPTDPVKIPTTGW